MTTVPRKALVFGLHNEIIDKVRVYRPGDDVHAAFVRFDGETETRVRRVRKYL